MMRPATRLCYLAILRLYRIGLCHKDIVAQLNLLSVDVVTNALHWHRQTKRRTNKDK